MDGKERVRPPVLGWLRLLSILGGLVLVSAGDWTGRTYYHGYHVPQGVGMMFIPSEELAHQLLYRLYGLSAVLLMAWGVAPVLARRPGPRLSRTPFAPVAAAAFVLLCGRGVGALVLGDAPVTDDENTYSFIGETLRRGALVSPSPVRDENDLIQFRERFVALSPTARYGKYSIGHPLLLAAGQALGAEAVVVPVVSALIAFPLYWLGCGWFGPRVAAVALALFATSPQILLTAGTRLSQPLSGLCALLGLWMLEAGVRRGRSRRGSSTAWMVGAGLAFGFGFLTRPLPGALLVSAGVAYLWWRTSSLETGTRIAALVRFAVPAALVGGVVLVTNYAQTGSPFSSGYQVAHNVSTEGDGLALLALGKESLQGRVFSLMGSLLRLDLWLFGWPLSLLPCFFARRSRASAGLLLFVLAVLTYRVLTPKQGVSPTGPVYVYEAIPFLCLLAASGLVRLARPGRLGALVPAAGLASSLVGFALFLPPKLVDLRLQGDAQATVLRLLDRVPGKLVVFTDLIALPGSSWAYFPRPNPPDYDSRVLFFRITNWDVGLQPNLDFARRRFPDRIPLFFGWFDGEPRLLRLEEYLSTANERSPQLRQTLPGSAHGPKVPR